MVGVLLATIMSMTIVIMTNGAFGFVLALVWAN